jgi:hypothetical protein
MKTRESGVPSSLFLTESGNTRPAEYSLDGWVDGPTWASVGVCRRRRPKSVGTNRRLRI